MARNCIAVGALLAMLAVVAGAFGAHGLEPVLNEQQRTWYDKALFYHFIHSLGLIGIGCSSLAIGPSRTLAASAVAMTLGVFGFSGSLYLLALTPVRWVSALAPIGGSAYIIAWLLLGIAALKASVREPGRRVQ
jgi:uncharacterized membrane protein YgdD (TMEM256/DUF423 family)